MIQEQEIPIDYKHYRLSDTKQKNKQQNGVLGGQEAPPARIKV